MDKIGAGVPKKQSASQLKYKSHSTFFRSPTKRRDFTIHPEWVSEIRADGRDTIDRAQRTATFPPRRSRTPDPITWRSWPTKDTSRPVLKTQKVDINQSFDKLGLQSSTERKQRNNYAFEGTCFSSRHQKRPYFTINPEWVSESLSVRGVSLQSKSSRTDASSAAIMQQRRCKSAPPPRSRNPITWENCMARRKETRPDTVDKLTPHVKRSWLREYLDIPQMCCKPKRWSLGSRDGGK